MIKRIKALFGIPPFVLKGGRDRYVFEYAYRIYGTHQRLKTAGVFQEENGEQVGFGNRCETNNHPFLLHSKLKPPNMFEFL